MSYEFITGEMIVRIIVLAIHIPQNTAGVSYAACEIINAHKTKEQSEHTNKHWFFCPPPFKSGI